LLGPGAGQPLLGHEDRGTLADFWGRIGLSVSALAILLQMAMRKDRRNLTTFGYFKLLLEAGSKRLVSTVALISPFETPQVL
jgi:hypothetical protein